MAPLTSCRISVSGHQDVVGTLVPHSLGHGILLLIGAEMSERKYITVSIPMKAHPQFSFLRTHILTAATYFMPFKLLICCRCCVGVQYRFTNFFMNFSSYYTVPRQTALKQFTRAY